MKLKGLVWFFAIALTVISLWELSYTWVVHNFEGTVTAKAERQVRKEFPNLNKDQRDDAIKARTQQILELDSTKELEIYPIIGTTYKKCKENELNLGLDLQGGISVTLDVSLDQIMRSLSNNPKDTAFESALNAATAERINNTTNYITLFGRAFKGRSGYTEGDLVKLFIGTFKDVQAKDNDDAVLSKLRTYTGGALKQTYDIIRKRVDRFGVAQPNINLDENKEIISVELAGVHDVERVKHLLQASAHLQFWELYRFDDMRNTLVAADEALHNYLNGVQTVDTTVAKDSLGKARQDSISKAKNQNPLFQVFSVANPQQAQDGTVSYAPYLGSVLGKDTPTLNRYWENPAVKSLIPADCKFLYSLAQKTEKGNQRFYNVYAIKMVSTSADAKAPLEGDAVDAARQDYDEYGKPCIKMEMNATGSKAWARLTDKNKGRSIAIVLDDIVYSAPNVANKIEGGSSEITGNFSIEEAQDLANVLKSGKLDAPAKIVAQQVVGPTLGQEAVKGGAKAFIIAFLVIFILMLVYYNTGGWVANIALILNLLFTIGVLTAMGFTLTAAGIAGLVLTIGMAVDTNVIIFERIKEELTKGKSYQLAVTDGYRRSLAPVIDAHVTSLLTAIILAYFGLGPVLGFATTQIIGILLSLFCGILVSRLITDFWTNKKRHFNYFTVISKKIFKHASFKFIEYRKVAYVISAIVLTLGIASYFNGFHLGVEFKGGRSYTVRFDQPVKNTDVQDELKAAFEGDFPIIKTVQDNYHLNITTSYGTKQVAGQTVVQNNDTLNNAMQLKLYTGLKKALPKDMTFDQFIEQKRIEGYIDVQPSISEDLKKGAIKATIFAILIIFLYIFIRFRDWRYSLGTIMTLLHDVLVTLAVFSFLKNIVPFPLEIDQHFIAAVLTVIGFSMNDTVIVFDRIREYSREMKNETKGNIINRAINDTLSRTIMTSLTVFLTILILFIFGGEVTRGFAFAMLIGVVTGTYSSIFVGAPILVDFAKNKPLGAADTVVTKKV